MCIPVWSVSVRCNDDFRTAKAAFRTLPKIRSDITCTGFELSSLFVICTCSCFQVEQQINIYQVLPPISVGESVTKLNTLTLSVIIKRTVHCYVKVNGVK